MYLIGGPIKNLILLFGISNNFIQIITKQESLQVDIIVFVSDTKHNKIVYSKSIIILIKLLETGTKIRIR